MAKKQIITYTCDVCGKDYQENELTRTAVPAKGRTKSGDEKSPFGYCDMCKGCIDKYAEAVRQFFGYMDMSQGEYPIFIPATRVPEAIPEKATGKGWSAVETKAQKDAVLAKALASIPKVTVPKEKSESNGSEPTVTDSAEEVRPDAPITEVKTDTRKKVAKRAEQANEGVFIVCHHKTTEEARAELAEQERAERTKKAFAKARRISKTVNDTDTNHWIGRINKRVQKIADAKGIPFPVALKTVLYQPMNKEYGFVADQVKKEYMEKYGLDEEPSVLRALTVDPIWMEIVESYLSDIEASLGIGRQTVNA